MGNSRKQNNTTLKPDQDNLLPKNDTPNVVKIYPSLEEINETITPESLIAKAEKIKKRLLELNNRMTTNPVLAYQYELFQKGKLVFNDQEQIPEGHQLINHEFTNILNEYGKINDDYALLKEDAVTSKVIGKNDAEKLEKKVLKDFNYHPSFQATLDESIKNINEKYRGLKSANTFKGQEISSSFADRAYTYQCMAVATGIGTLLTKGAFLPIFLGGVMIGLIDSFITALRLGSVVAKSVKLDGEKAKELQETKEKIDNEVEKDSYNRFQQTFFSVCKSKQSLNLDKKEKPAEGIKKETPTDEDEVKEKHVSSPRF